MTTENIEITEEQAREYCRLIGENPDERVPDPTNTTMAFVTCPKWKVVRLILQKQEAVLRVLRPNYQ